MKNRFAVLTAMLLFLFAGCSFIQKGQKQNIVGAWTGKGVTVNLGVYKNWQMTMVFNEDKTFSLLYEADGKKTSFKGNYIVDLTKHPATLDIIDFGFTTSKLTYDFKAIAEFPKKNRMIFFGVMGKLGEVSFPTEIPPNPTNHYQLYCELTRKE